MASRLLRSPNPHLFSASHLTQIITPSGLTYTTFPDTRSPLENPLSQQLSANMTSLLSLQLANLYYVNLGSLQNLVCPKTISQRNVERRLFHNTLKFFRNCIGTIYYLYLNLKHKLPYLCAMKIHYEYCRNFCSID